MGKPPKRAESLQVEVEEGGGFALRLPGWMSRKAVAGIVALAATSAGGVWTGVSKVYTVDDRMAAWTTEQRLVAEAKAGVDEAAYRAILDRLDRLEAAQLARLERIEAAHALLAQDVAVHTAALARVDRRRGR